MKLEDLSAEELAMLADCVRAAALRCIAPPGRVIMQTMLIGSHQQILMNGRILIEKLRSNFPGDTHPIRLVELYLKLVEAL